MCLEIKEARARWNDWENKNELPQNLYLTLLLSVQQVFNDLYTLDFWGQS